jgi:hypothetical protein
MQEEHFSSTHYLNCWLWWNVNVLSNVLYERFFEVRNNIVTESAVEVCWNTVNNLKFTSSPVETPRLLCHLWTPIAQTWGCLKYIEVICESRQKRFVVIGSVVYFVTYFGQVGHLQVTYEMFWRKLWTISTIKRNEAWLLHKIFLMYKVMLHKCLVPV